MSSVSDRAWQDIIRMIVQYLEDEEYTTSMMTVQDEANVKISANTKRRNRIRRLQASILGTKIQ